MHRSLPYILLLVLTATLPSRAGLTLQNTWFGYQNLVNTAGPNTTVQSANATYTSQFGNNLPNAFQNGGFDWLNGGTLTGGNGLTTEANAKFVVNNRPGANSLAIPSWTHTGDPPAGSGNNGVGGPYGVWGNNGAGKLKNSGAIPQGANAVYFGNSNVSSSSGNGSQQISAGNNQFVVPFFNADGTATFRNKATSATVASAYIRPGNANSGAVHVADTLSQTVTGLSVGKQYSFSFWASGEDATTGSFASNGIFFLNITGEATTFTNTYDNTNWAYVLQAPGGVNTYSSTHGAAFGSSHYYQFLFTPTASTITFTWGNYGHLLDSTNASIAGTNFMSELVLDDVTLIQLQPEASNLTLAMGGTALLGLRRFRSRPRPAAPGG